jgi:polyisoprenoid-binding protein YceI
LTNEAVKKPGDISARRAIRERFAVPSKSFEKWGRRSVWFLSSTGGRGRLRFAYRWTRMNAWRNNLWVLAVAASGLLSPSTMSAQQSHIDADKSIIVIHVGKSGLFSGFAHDHDIAAPITSGNVYRSAPLSVELRVDARTLRVRDPGASAKDRKEIQTTMLGPEVLDSERHQEIVFKSGTVEALGASHWTVRGELTLRGQTRPVTAEVAEKAGHYTGRATVKQTDFGIKPVKVAGGTVKVKDEVQVEFDIQLSP